MRQPNLPRWGWRIWLAPHLAQPHTQRDNTGTPTCASPITDQSARSFPHHGRPCDLHRDVTHTKPGRGTKLIAVAGAVRMRMKLGSVFSDAPLWSETRRLSASSTPQRTGSFPRRKRRTCSTKSAGAVSAASCDWPGNTTRRLFGSDACSASVAAV